MTNIVLNNISSGYNIAKVNDNFDKIESALNTDVLHISGGGNVLSQDLDINSNDLLNVGTLNASTIELDGAVLMPEELVLTNAVLKADLASTATGKGSSLVGFLQAGTGAVSQDLQQALRDLPVTVEQFGAVGDGRDDALAINKALAAAGPSGGTVYANKKTYSIASVVSVPPGVTFYCDLQNMTPGSDMVYAAAKSKIIGRLVGAGSTGGAIERGIYNNNDATSCGVYLDVDISNLTVAVQCGVSINVSPMPSGWYGYVYAHDLTGGGAANSNGYGLLLNGATGCNISLITKNVTRHDLYLSNGSFGNNIKLSSEGNQYVPVNINTQSSFGTATRAVCDNHIEFNLKNVEEGALTCLQLNGFVQRNKISGIINGTPTTLQVFVSFVSQPSGNYCEWNDVDLTVIGTNILNTSNGYAAVSVDGYNNNLSLRGSGYISNAPSAAYGIVVVCNQNTSSVIPKPSDALFCLSLKELTWNANGAATKAASSNDPNGYGVPILIYPGAINVSNTTNNGMLSLFNGATVSGYAYDKLVEIPSTPLAASSNVSVTILWSVNTGVSPAFVSIAPIYTGLVTGHAPPTYSLTYNSSGVTIKFFNNSVDAITITGSVSYRGI